MEIVFYSGIVLFLLFGPWILVWRAFARRKSDRLEDQSRWAELTGRMHALERELKELRGSVVAPTAADAPKQEIQQPATPTAGQPQPTVASEAKAPSQAAIETWVTKRPSQTIRPTSPVASKVPVPSTAPAPTSAPSPGSTFAATESGPSLVDRFKSSLDVEEMLGTDWLNKLGIILLVLGIAFFLAYQLRTMGPAGKVLVGLVTSAVLLGAGIWFERGDRYRILARAAIGGGWALLFFTTYAMYHVPAAQVLDSQLLDMVLMLAVAGAMVGQTLRYRSQVVTGLAFLLAFLTIAIHHSDVYSLTAGAVLAAALVVIVGRMEWFELELVRNTGELSEPLSVAAADHRADARQAPPLPGVHRERGNPCAVLADLPLVLHVSPP